jgi:hypothetical protein
MIIEIEMLEIYEAMLEIKVFLEYLYIMCTWIKINSNFLIYLHRIGILFFLI